MDITPDQIDVARQEAVYVLKCAADLAAGVVEEEECATGLAAPVDEKPDAPDSRVPLTTPMWCDILLSDWLDDAEMLVADVQDAVILACGCQHYRVNGDSYMTAHAAAVATARAVHHAMRFASAHPAGNWVTGLLIAGYDYPGFGARPQGDTMRQHVQALGAGYSRVYRFLDDAVTREWAATRRAMGGADDVASIAKRKRNYTTCNDPVADERMVQDWRAAKHSGVKSIREFCQSREIDVQKFRAAYDRDRQRKRKK